MELINGSINFQNKIINEKENLTLNNIIYAHANKALTVFGK